MARVIDEHDIALTNFRFQLFKLRVDAVFREVGRKHGIFEAEFLQSRLDRSSIGNGFFKCRKRAVFVIPNDKRMAGFS